MIERHNTEGSLAVRVLILSDMSHGGRTFRSLTPRHAFRLGRGARRVEHDRPGVGADARLGIRGLALEQRLEFDFVAPRCAKRNALARLRLA